MYHLYIISEDMNFEDAVVLTYGDSMQRDIHKKRESHLGDVNPTQPFEEKKSADDAMS